jgi:hypothetical protein
MRPIFFTRIAVVIATHFLLNDSIVLGQANNETICLKSDDKKHFYYVLLNNTNGTVYEMGTYFDKNIGKSKYRIVSTDSLINQPGGTYLGGHTKIIAENYKPYLITKDKKIRKIKLNVETNLSNAYTTINKAYFLDKFLVMGNEVSGTYQKYHYMVVDEFDEWKQLPNTNIDPSQFSLYINEKFWQIKDSIGSMLDPYVLLLNDVTRNIITIDYNSLCDSLVRLCFTPDDRYYYLNLTNVVAKQKPEYFFRLAEDLPEYRHAILLSGAYNMVFSINANKKDIERLMAVEGYNETKKEFSKNAANCRTDKIRPLASMVATVGTIALVLLIVL